MDAVLLALASAAFFGAMSVAIRFGLARGGDAVVGAILTVVPALLVVLVVVGVEGARGDALHVADAWPFFLAGLIGPGLSQIFFTLAVRDAGPSRTSVLVGSAPLFSVAIALAFLSEPANAGLLVGALLIVVGGLLFAVERRRPAHFRALGVLFALVATVLFAVRDNLLRWLAVDTAVPSSVAAAATLVAGLLVVGGYAAATRVRLSTLGLERYAVAGVLFGLSYAALFEAYYRGRVVVVSPLVATESLWGVLFSVLLMRRAELVGARLLGGAALVVAGGALIGTFR